MKNFVFTLSVSILFYSCGKELDLNGNETFEPLAIMNCVMSVGEPIIVQFVQSKSPGDSGNFKIIEDAFIEINNGNIKYQDFFLKKPKDDFNLEYYLCNDNLLESPKGETFTIKASNVNGTFSIVANTTVPGRPSIKSISLVDSKLFEYPGRKGTYNFNGIVEIEFETIEPNSFFQLEGNVENDTYYNLFNVKKDSVYFSKCYLNFLKFEGETFFDTFEAKENAIRNNKLLVEVSSIINSSKAIPDSMNFEIRSITKNYFEYLQDLDKMVKSSQDPFGFPFIVRTNIENGYGIFAITNPYKINLKI